MLLFRILKSLFAGLLLALIFVSCSENAPVSEDVETVVSGDQFWADSVFGKLTAEQQYFQHVLIEVPAYYQQASDSLVKWIITHQPGALSFNGWDPDSVEMLRESIDTQLVLKPFFIADYFEMIGAKPYPFWEVNESSCDKKWTSFFSKGGYHLLDFRQDIFRGKKEIDSWLDTIIRSQNIVPFTAHYNDQDSSKNLEEFLNLIKGSSTGALIELNYFDTVNIAAYRKAYEYDGLTVIRSKEQAINGLIEAGADFVFRRLESPESFTSWNPANSESDAFAESTRRILLIKSMIGSGSKRVNASEELNYIRLNMQANSVSLLRNEKKIIPFKSKFTVYSDREFRVLPKVRSDCGASLITKKIEASDIDQILASKGNKVILIGDSCSADLLTKLAAIKPADQTVVAFSNPENYGDLKNCSNLIYYPSFNEFDASLLLQQLSSRLPIQGDFYSADTLIAGLKISQKLLARTDPNFCGLDGDTLSRISGLMSSCMNGRAFPGAQVLIAKDGCIVYDRVFGKHTYQGQTPVTENSMYDLASLTKVVATTMVGMKLYEMGVYEMNDSLGQYLPDSLKQHLRFPSTIRNITFQELFTHTSGLPAGFPIIKYMQYTSSQVGRYDRYFCDRPDSVYMTEVAEGFYLEKEQQDSMWLRLNQIYLDPAKPYKYSDVNMNTLYFMFKSFIQKDPAKYGFTQSKKQLEGKNLFEEFLYNTFYKPLGMNHTCYKPLKRFSKDLIVPTENETFWRKQLLHGYVHDPNAALHGGIAGNAGIFSTSNDLAILLQMLLNKGVYNDQRYLKAETVDKFTSRQENCFRGLGFNKPSMGSTSFGMSENASMSTYGHTGFTGTCFWVDPEHGLIYIYLSNAVHPSVNNKSYEYGIRKKVHQCAYDAMMTKDF